MRKITSLLMLLCMFVGTAWADGFVVGLTEVPTQKVDITQGLQTGYYLLKQVNDQNDCAGGQGVGWIKAASEASGASATSKNTGNPGEDGAMYIWYVEVVNAAERTIKISTANKIASWYLPENSTRQKNLTSYASATTLQYHYENQTKVGGCDDTHGHEIKPGAALISNYPATSYIHFSGDNLGTWNSCGTNSTYMVEFYQIPEAKLIYKKNVIISLDEVNKEKAYVIYTREAAFTVNDDMTALKPTGKNVAWDKENANNHFTFVNLGGDYFLYSVAAQKFMKIDATLEKDYFEDPIEFVKCTSYPGRVRMRFKKDTSKNIDFNSGRTAFDIGGWTYEDEGTAFYVEEIADFDFSTLEPSLVAFKKTDYAAWETEYRTKYVGQKLGQYKVDEDALELAKSELNAAETLDAVGAAIEKCKAAFVLNEPVLNTYYRIKNTKHATYTAFDGYTLNMKNVAFEENDPTQLWQYVKEGDKLYMKNVYSALYPQSIPSGGDNTAKLGVGKDKPFTYALHAPATADVDAQWNIFFGGTQVNIEASGNVNYWFQDGAHHNLYEVEITDDALVAMCVNWYEEHPYEYVAPDVTAADFQKIDIDPNATVVISPSEFAAPAEINAAIDKLAELNKTMQTPVVEDIDDIHALFAAIAGYTGAVNALNEYKSAVTSYGELLSIAYTPKAEWGTIILPINWAKPEGWTRYSCSAIEGNVLTLNEYAEGSTKNNPMIIKVEEEKVGITYQLIGYSNGAGTENVTKGLLTGVLEDDTQVPTASYILADYNDVVAFYPVAEGANYAASKYKCYLTLPATEARYSALYFEGGETAIENIEGAEVESAVVYDLSGRRVQKAQKGVFIVNGKVVIK